MIRMFLSKSILAGSLLAICALGGSSVARAASITFAFTGVVTQIQAFNPAMVGLPATINDTVNGLYTFESTTGSPCAVNGACLYTGAITDLRFTVGNYTNTGPGEPINSISVKNGSIIAPNSFDDYIVFSGFSGPSLGGVLDANQFHLRVMDPSGNMFDNTTLPITPPLLTPNTSWSVLWSNSSGAGNVQLSGTVTSLNPVPLPSTLLLFCSGIIGLAVWRWRVSVS